MLTEIRQKKLKKLFRVFDANNNGSLDMNDVSIIANNFTKEFGWSEDGDTNKNFKSSFLKVWTAMFREADFNNDKQITTEEFLKYYEDVSANDALYFQCIKPFFDALFSSVDTDNDGLLSKNQYKAFYRAWGNSDEAAEEAFQQVDANKDGSISHLELYTMFYYFFMSDRDNDKSQIFFGKLD